MNSVISVIEKELGSVLLSNDQIIQECKDSSLTDFKIQQKIGVKRRYICADDEFASDLAIRAGLKALEKNDKREIDFLIYCTQSPDYLIPTTACILHERLGLRKDCGALDINLGCSGWTYAITLADSLIYSQVAKKVLIICADSYSKYIDPMDASNRSIFGDAATATIVSVESGYGGYLFRVLPHFQFGTDGSGADFLSVQTSGLKGAIIGGNKHLHMDGAEIYNFCLDKIPKLKEALMDKAKLNNSSISLYVFHQASKVLLDSLAYKMKIPEHKMIRSMEHTGNTVSSTIPIALMDVIENNRSFQNDLIMCLGFGVGLSWSGLILKRK